ncbi:MAG: protoporphyrinogen oxidase, partial [Opitutae bacterium]|nr:protoporphyrinogen oxidase [Opitutae bacterium]
MRRTIIVGAGLCGLVAARTCRDEGREVLILEAGGYPGGVIRSERRGGYLIEHGPNTLALRAGHATDYLEQMGLLGDAIDANPEANKRFLVREGRLVAVPASASSFLNSPLFSIVGKLRLLLEPLLPRGDARENESVADFFKRRLGKEVRDYAANPFIAGVYAARPETLVLRHAFPT